jgi:hypothetical protein
LTFEQQKSLLKSSISSLTRQASAPVPEPLDINKLIKLDSQLINFGKFVSGKMLGSTLQVKNTSKQTQIVEIAINSSDDNYLSREIFEPFAKKELPFEESKPVLKNSEIEFSCWHIENPHSKQLHKSLTLKMGPQSEQEFIIVLKVPQRKQSYNFVSFIDVRLRT